MEQKTKERLVGSIVLLCLAVIFIPPFYDGRNPFDLDEKAISGKADLAPRFKSSEDMASDIAQVGTGHIAKIEKKVDASLSEDSRNDSQLEKEDAGILEDLNASEMTTRLLNDIAENSELASRFAKQNNLKQAWAVQVGSFEEVDRAQNLRDQLVKAGFHAYIKTFLKDGKTISRVFAGVSLDKGVAEEIKTNVEKQFDGVSSIVIPYQS